MMKKIVLALALSLLVSGCCSVSFDDPSYVWEDWDFEQIDE